nr:hypothetical protein [Tanacetum cinerariifolium]
MVGMSEDKYGEWKPKRNDTHVPQPSGPTESVAYEPVDKELGDRLVTAATTAFSLGAEQDNESFKDEESLGEDASKQGRRIDAIDDDDEITLVNDADNEMFDVDDLVGEAMFVAGQNDNVVEEILDVAHVSTAATTATITTEEITLAEALEALKTLKPKKRRKYFAAKRADEKRNKPPTKAQQRKIMYTYLKNMKGYKLKILKLKEFDRIQEMFDRAFRRVNTFEDFRPELVERKENRAGEELEQEIIRSKRWKMIKAELKQLMKTISDEEEVEIDAILLAVKSPTILDWKIHKEGKKSYYQIVRADGKSHMYMIFSQMLKSFNKEDLEDLYKLVKARYGSTRPVENMDYLL